MKVKKIVSFLLIVTFTCFFLFFVNGYCQNRALVKAIEENDLESVKNSISRGAFVDLPRVLFCIPEITPLNPTPLITACEIGNLEIIELLLNNGADVNKRDNASNETPLMAALQGKKENRFSLALLLIERGADMHVRQTANSPFVESLYISDQDTQETIDEGYQLFQLLMQNDVDMTVYVSQQNALTYAAQYRNYNAVRYLIESGNFGVNSFDAGGNTALITAAKYGNTDIVELLLELGADKLLEDRDKKTAYDHAVEKQNTKIATLLSD